MTPAELIPIIREAYLDDVTDIADQDGLEFEDSVAFSTSWLLREIGTAQRQACYRQDLRHLYDASTPAICAIALQTGVADYALDPRILRLQEVRHGVSVLEHTTQALLERGLPTWRTTTPARPRAFFVTARTLTLWPTPGASEAGDTLSLSVWREPLADPGMHDDLEWTQEPEQLAYWVAFRAFARPGQVITDHQQALQYRAMFDQAFGTEVKAKARAELLAYPNHLSFAPEVYRATRRACTFETED